MILRPGNSPSLSAMGMGDRISSARIVARPMPVPDTRYAPAPVVTYDARRRNGERLFEAPVVSVRAVVGPPERRCWAEREQVSGGGDTNVGALIGGVLGHQVGGGRGKDVATAGGAIAGAAIGSQAGGGGGPSYGRNVERCETVARDTRPDHWDVVYSFRGREHRMQMASPPGRTVTVNSQGEPRV